ncbi:MAG: PEGA domain-containing protein [Planctomycetes bacterium]|nr:PEGA domain-containing protein [Planctomycetota bacterium]
MNPVSATATATAPAGGARVRPGRPPAAVLALVALLACAGLSGCVDRKIEVESDPPGADVWVDGKHLGKTPIAIPFTYYGGRDLRLEKEGYQSIRVLHSTTPPVFEYFPVDLVSECIIPFNLHDVKSLRFDLEPVREADLKELVERADALRFRTRSEVAQEQEAVAPVAPAAAPTAPAAPVDAPAANVPPPAAPASDPVRSDPVRPGPDRSSRR